MAAKSPHRSPRTAHFASALVLAAGLAFGAGATARDAASSTAAHAELPSTAEAWSTAAKRDVEAAYRLFVDNHPGMFNQEDPGFPARLREARDRGLELAPRVRDAAGYSAALQAFSAGLRDGHAKVVANLPDGAVTQRWPGFVAVWRGNGLRVFGSSVPEAPAGATILDCDGRDIRTLVLENVFAYGGRPDESGQWWARATDLFRDDGNPLVKIPQRCHVSAGGKVSDLALSWRPVDDRYRAWRQAGYNGETLAPGLTEPRSKLFWLALPTFEPDEAQRTAYRSAFDELQRRRSEVLAGDAVVIDLRGNQGGSSFWGEEATKALWGSKAVDAFDAADPSRAWWRASSENTRYVSGMADTLRAQGQPELVAFLDRAAAGMKAALAKGEPYWDEPADPALASAAPSADIAPLKTPVYVIVPGQCASACLDALDVFAHFPNTKLIGAPSSADSVYLEIRVATLPDGLAKVVIPNKLYRNRPRASGQVYKPAIEVDDLQWSTAAFRNVVEADLRARELRPALVSGGSAHAAAQPTPEAAASAPGPHTFQAGGVRLWYRVAGPASGEPVVFLHGGPGEGSQTFAKFAGPALEDRLRMVYLDQRGSGRSERPKDPAAYSIDRLVEDVEALRQELGVQRISLIGHSFGTVLALEYAARHPEHVSRVVLAAAAPDLPTLLQIQCNRLKRTDSAAYARAAAGAGRCNPFAAYAGDAQKAFIERNMFPDPATARIVDASDSADGLGNTGELAGAIFDGGFLGYRFRKAAAVSAPVLILAGGADQQAVVEPQRALAAALPRGRIVVLPGRGHFMFVEDPDGFARLVVPFLQPPER